MRDALRFHRYVGFGGLVARLHASALGRFSMFCSCGPRCKKACNVSALGTFTCVNPHVSNLFLDCELQAAS